MKLEIESSQLNGLIVIRHDVFRDGRGFFWESYHREAFRDLGLTMEFVQDNHSRSGKNVLRGLHFQWDPPMGKLIWVTRGRAFLVAVDIRKGSPTFGRWWGREVSEDSGVQVWAPAGFARGALALTDPMELQYKCTGLYNSLGEGNILWDDRDIGIAWPCRDVVLSDRDKQAPTLAQWSLRPESEYLTYDSTG